MPTQNSNHYLTDDRMIRYRVYKDGVLMIEHEIYSQWVSIVNDIYVTWHSRPSPHTIEILVNGKWISLNRVYN
jgi:hypothetical protein